MSTVRFPHVAQTQEQGETCGRETERGMKTLLHYVSVLTCNIYSLTFVMM